MNQKNSFITTAFVGALSFTSAHAQQGKTVVPPSVLTPDNVETQHLGTLNFKDGIPDAATAQKLYDDYWASEATGSSGCDVARDS